jgi:hypothetical protein
VELAETVRGGRVKKEKTEREDRKRRQKEKTEREPD